MPARFLPPADFPRLSDAAKSLAGQPAPDPLPEGWVSGFELEAMTAETLHGLLALPVEADADARVLVVVAEQVNFRLAAGDDHGTKGSEQRANQSAVVARNPFTGEAHALSPVAKALAAQLLAEYAAQAVAAVAGPGTRPGYSPIEFHW